MSYLDILPELDKLHLTRHSSFDEFYQNEQAYFEEHSAGAFSDYKLTVENCVFLHDCNFTGKIECELDFKNCYFLTDVTFYNVIVSNKLVFRQCFFDQAMQILGSCVFQKEFHLIQLSTKKQLYVEGGKFEDCKWSFLDNGIVKVNGGDYLSLNIGYWGGGSILSQLSLHLPKVKGLVRVTGDKSKIEQLNLFQFASDVSISIEDITVNSISIYRFRNEKSLRLSNIKSFETTTASQFSVVESYLGKAELYSINLRDFKSIHLVDSHLVDCFLINILFPNHINAYKGRLVGKSASEEVLIAKIELLETRKPLKGTKRPKYDQSIITYYEKKRETLRQIKYALSKQGDSVNEQRFHSLEMKAHDRSLTWKRSFWTKLIIKASSWTSDFGQSIWRPLIGLLLGHMLLFLFLVLLGGVAHLSISLSQHSEQGFRLAFEKYFQLINPLRRNEIPFDGYFILIDIIMRIWASYMIYNIIRASRRFIK